jgi:hypothetical protein
MKCIEEKLWDEITNSAKKKFDYKAFKKGIPAFVADEFLFKVIMSLACNRPVNILASEIQCNMMVQGFHISLETITSFIIEKKAILGIEVLASQMAMDMLEKNTPPEIVYAKICQVLGK